MQNTIAAVTAPRVPHLLELAVRGLESMYDTEKGLFCYRLQKTSQGVTRQGISHRYTVMTLLGLLRAASAGLRPSVDIETSVDRLLNNTTWLDNLGDFGLLLWLCAATSRKHVRRFHTIFNIRGALERFPDARQRMTMELSWLLTGLAHACKIEGSADLELLTHETYGLIRRNQGQHGLFGHMATWRSLPGVLRGRVGSFADQVYPIVAMAHYSQVFDIKEACDNALRCGRAISRLQGPLGQWWWHYDAVSGIVVEHYPVYSVHQHAMAPMALLALEHACGADFRRHINNGLQWINGANELHEDLEDSNAGVVWRCIRSKRSGSFAGGVHALMGKKPPVGPVETLYECRPYELGWLLYVFAGLSLPFPVGNSEC